MTELHPVALDRRAGQPASPPALLGAGQQTRVVEGYEGVRVGATGRRFLIQNATIWTATSGEGDPLGQAATFDRWTPVP